MEKENKPIKQPVMRAKIEVPSEVVDYDFKGVAVPFDNGQLKIDWENDTYFNEVLIPTPENTRTERLDSGLPLFDNHPWDKSATNTLGITTRYAFTENGLEIYCKWGARADEALKNDVANGIIKTFSIEGDIYSYEVSREIGKIPVYKTLDWEPTSVSLAPVPNDIASQIDVQRKINEQIEQQKIKSEKSIINSLKEKFT